MAYTYKLKRSNRVGCTYSLEVSGQGRTNSMMSFNPSALTRDATTTALSIQDEMESKH